MGETLVRPAKPRDVDAIVALHRAMHAEHVTVDPARWTTPTSPADVYPTWVDELIGRGVAMVGEIEGAVVGYALAEVEAESPRHWSPAALYLHDLFVLPSHRRAGVARRLVDAVFAWRDARRPTLPIRLLTAASNEPARAFFARLGFRPAAVEMIEMRNAER